MQRADAANPSVSGTGVDELQSSFNHMLQRVGGATLSQASRDPNKDRINRNRSTGGIKGLRNKRATHSMEVFEHEFSKILERKEYT